MSGAPLVLLEGVRVRHGRTTVLDHLDLMVVDGRHTVLTGPSGAGKTTALRVVLGSVRPRSGRVEVAGRAVRGRRTRDRWLRPLVQHVAQDATGSLAPRRTVAQSVAEPLVCLEGGRASEHLHRVHELLDLVGLAPGVASRRPHELSGGQRQRVALARALAVRPRLLVADEPFSGLDPSTQLTVATSLRHALEAEGTTLLLVTHDLGPAALVCRDLVVVEGGRVVDLGPLDEVRADPRHPTTRAVVAPRGGGSLR